MQGELRNAVPGYEESLSRMNFITEEEGMDSHSHFCSILDTCSLSVSATFDSLAGYLDKQLCEMERFVLAHCFRELGLSFHGLIHLDRIRWWQDCVMWESYAPHGYPGSREKRIQGGAKARGSPQDVTFPLSSDVLPLRAPFPIFISQ